MHSLKAQSQKAWTHMKYSILIRCYYTAYNMLLGPENVVQLGKEDIDVLY